MAQWWKEGQALGLYRVAYIECGYSFIDIGIYGIDLLKISARGRKRKNTDK
jgi:hypothetical protein